MLDTEEDQSPLILGRPFLNTAKASIEVHEGKLTLRIDNEHVSFYLPKKEHAPNEHYFRIDSITPNHASSSHAPFSHSSSSLQVEQQSDPLANSINLNLTNDLQVSHRDLTLQEQIGEKLQSKTKLGDALGTKNRETNSYVRKAKRKLDDINKRKEPPGVEWVDKHILPESCVLTQRHDEQPTPTRSVTTFAFLPHQLMGHRVTRQSLEPG